MEEYPKPIKYIDSYGTKRNGFLCLCQVCKKEFTIRKRRKQTKLKHDYCSIKCFNIVNNTTEVCCSYCNTQFIKSNSSLNNSKSGLYFCTRICKDKAQKLEYNLTAIHPDHFGTAQDHNYNKISENKQLCIDCGDTRKYLLQVHHIDGDRKNDSINNLEVVCLMCHGRRHIDTTQEKPIINWKKLTPRDQIKNY